MTNKEFIQRVSANSELTQKEITNVLDAVELALKSELSVDNAEVKVCDITLVNKIRPARTGRNPKTGETISIAASNGLGFKTSADWKRILKG